MSCAGCGADIPSGVDRCRACGKSTRIALPAPLPASGSPRLAALEGRKTARWLFRALDVMVLLDALAIAAALLEVRFLGNASQGWEPARDPRYLVLCGAQLAASVALLLLFIDWVGGSYANLKRLGSRDLHFTPARAALAFLVPVLNLVLPFFAVAEIWRESDPSDAKKSWFSSHVLAWWVFTVAAHVAAFKGARTILATHGRLDDPASGWEILAGALVVHIVAALTAVVMVREIDRMQAEKAGQKRDRAASGRL